jgi:aminoglycoside phosphotransferase
MERCPQAQRRPLGEGRAAAVTSACGRKIRAGSPDLRRGLRSCLRLATRADALRAVPAPEVVAISAVQPASRLPPAHGWPGTGSRAGGPGDSSASRVVTACIAADDRTAATEPAGQVCDHRPVGEPERGVVHWAVRTLCPGGQLVGIRDLHEDFGPWLVQCTGPSGAEVFSGILRVGSDDGSRGKDAKYVRIEAAALRIAQSSGIDAPRLLGLDADGAHAGRVASLQTVLDGEPLVRTPYSRTRLRSLGEQLATVHQINVEPSAHLSVRQRSLEPGEGYIEERHLYAGSARWAAGERLFRDAEAELARHPRPADRVSLVHGDAWIGNAMAVDDRCAGLFDWGCAGVGHPGIDLGHTRLTTALRFGMDAADDVLAGWEAKTGAPLSSTPYWDVVGALLTPPDIGDNTHTRDEFLMRALDDLGRHRRDLYRQPLPTF